MGEGVVVGGGGQGAEGAVVVGWVGDLEEFFAPAAVDGEGSGGVETEIDGGEGVVYTVIVWGDDVGDEDGAVVGNDCSEFGAGAALAVGFGDGEAVAGGRWAPADGGAGLALA